MRWPAARVMFAGGSVDDGGTTGHGKGGFAAAASRKPGSARDLEGDADDARPAVHADRCADFTHVDLILRVYLSEHRHELLDLGRLAVHHPEVFDGARLAHLVDEGLQRLRAGASASGLLDDALDRDERL